MVTVMESKVEGGNNRPNCMVTPVLEETFQSFDLLIFFFICDYVFCRKRSSFIGGVGSLLSLCDWWYIGEPLSKNIPSPGARRSMDHETMLRFYCSVFCLFECHCLLKKEHELTKIVSNTLHVHCLITLPETSTQLLTFKCMWKPGFTSLSGPHRKSELRLELWFCVFSA